jgi:integrase
LTIRNGSRGIVTAQIFSIILSITAIGSTTWVILKGVNMARTVQPLTNTQVKQAKSKDKVYDLSDGGGLQLRIKPNGSKLWNFFYPRPTTKKRNTISFGSYPEVTLAQARELRKEARALLAQGIDPKAYREETQAAKLAEETNTLANVAAQWFEKKKKGVTQAHGEDIWRSLEIHAFPTLGQFPISSITAPKAIAALRPLETSQKLDTLKRVNQRLNEVMDFAVNTGLVHSNPLTGIKAAFDKPIKKNNPHIAPEQLPELMADIAKANARKVTKLLLTWQLHTMTRPNEAAGARWDEIDLENRTWLIPKERMKGRMDLRREHRIPLTDQMISILEEVHQISSNSPYIFPGDRNHHRPANEQTANNALKSMGYQGIQTAHGLRGLASTTLHDNGFEHIVIEACLAHRERNSVSAAYNHSDYFERRKPVMSWWSEYIEQASYGNLSLTGTRTLKVV